MEKGKRNKRSKAGMWLIWFGALTPPAMLIGAYIGTTEAGGDFQFPPNQLIETTIICVILIIIGVVINIRQTRKERNAETTAADNSHTTE